MDNQQKSEERLLHEVELKGGAEKLGSDDDSLDRHETESDVDPLEPQEFGTGEILLNVDDPSELRYWAEHFQISMDELRAATLLQGNSIREIKKYLST